jgi:hypothetical protein
LDLLQDNKDEYITMLRASLSSVGRLMLHQEDDRVLDLRHGSGTKSYLEKVGTK